VPVAVGVVDTVQQRPIPIDPESTGGKTCGFPRIGTIPFADQVLDGDGMRRVLKRIVLSIHTALFGCPRFLSDLQHGVAEAEATRLASCASNFESDALSHLVAEFLALSHWMRGAEVSLLPVHTTSALFAGEVQKNSLPFRPASGRSVSTRVLSSHMAVAWTAFFNFIAFLFLRPKPEGFYFKEADEESCSSMPKSRSLPCKGRGSHY
jgi:hypothetical protein